MIKHIPSKPRWFFSASRFFVGLTKSYPFGIRASGLAEGKIVFEDQKMMVKPPELYEKEIGPLVITLYDRERWVSDQEITNTYFWSTTPGDGWLLLAHNKMVLEADADVVMKGSITVNSKLR